MGVYWKLEVRRLVALPVPVIIGGTQNFGIPLIRPRPLFPQIFKGLLFGWTP